MAVGRRSLLAEAAWLTSGVNLSPDHFRKCEDLLLLLHAKTRKGFNWDEGREREAGRTLKAKRVKLPKCLLAGACLKASHTPKGALTALKDELNLQGFISDNLLIVF